MSRLCWYLYILIECFVFNVKIASPNVCSLPAEKKLFTDGVFMRSAPGTPGGRESGRPCRTDGQTAFCRVFSAPRRSDGNAAIENE